MSAVLIHPGILGFLVPSDSNFAFDRRQCTIVPMHGWLQVAAIETVVSESDIFGQFQHHRSGPLAEEQSVR